MEFQFSFDGTEQTINKRKADPDRISNNIIKVIEGLNEIEIHNNM